MSGGVLDSCPMQTSRATCAALLTVFGCGSWATPTRKVAEPRRPEPTQVTRAQPTERDRAWYATRHGTCQKPLAVRQAPLRMSVSVNSQERIVTDPRVPPDEVAPLVSALEAKRASLRTCLPSGGVELLLNPASVQPVLSHVCGAASEETVACLQGALAGLPVNSPMLLSVGAFEPQVSHGPEASSTKEGIRQSILARIEDVRSCYNDALTLKPDLRGTVAIKFIIAATGAVLASQVIDDQTGDAELACCINHSLRLWDFPKPPGCGIVVVTYPFVLEPAAGD